MTAHTVQDDGQHYFMVGKSLPMYTFKHEDLKICISLAVYSITTMLSAQRDIIIGYTQLSFKRVNLLDSYIL